MDIGTNKVTKEIVFVKDNDSSGNYVRVYSSKGRVNVELMVGGDMIECPVVNGTVLMPTVMEHSAFYNGRRNVEFWASITSYITVDNVMFTFDGKLFKIPIDKYNSLSYSIQSTPSVFKKRFIPLDALKDFEVLDTV